MEDREEAYMLVILVQIMFFFLRKTKEVTVDDFPIQIVVFVMDDILRYHK